MLDETEMLELLFGPGYDPDLWVGGSYIPGQTLSDIRVCICSGACCERIDLTHLDAFPMPWPMLHPAPPIRIVCQYCRGWAGFRAHYGDREEDLEWVCTAIIEGGA